MSLDPDFTTSTTTVTTRADTTADIEVGPEAENRDRSSGRADDSDEQVYPTGVSTPIANAQECPQLCRDRSEWCVGFVVQHTTGGELVCHQLRLIRISHLNDDDARADSYEIVEVTSDYSTVDGDYIFEGTIEACESACSEESECVMAMAGDGFCAWAKEMTETSVSPSTLHDDLVVAVGLEEFGHAGGALGRVLVEL